MLTRPEVDKTEANSHKAKANFHEAEAKAKAKTALIFFSQIFYILTHFLKKMKFSVDFWRDFKKFPLKTGFNMGTLLIYTHKTTSYTFGRRLLLYLHTE